jgi:hypothetical protein
MNDTLPNLKRGPGRPVTGSAKTGAQRQDAYRKRQAARYMDITILRDDADALNAALVFARDHGPDQGLEVSAESLSRLLKQLDKATAIKTKAERRSTDAPPVMVG